MLLTPHSLLLATCYPLLSVSGHLFHQIPPKELNTLIIDPAVFEKLDPGYLNNLSTSPKLSAHPFLNTHLVMPDPNPLPRSLAGGVAHRFLVRCSARFGLVVPDTLEEFSRFRIGPQNVLVVLLE